MPLISNEPGPVCPPSHRDLGEVGSSILGGVHEPAHAHRHRRADRLTHASMQRPMIGLRRRKGAGPAKLGRVAKPKSERGL